MIFVQDGKLESITNAPAAAQQAGAAPAGRPKSRAGKKRARIQEEYSCRNQASDGRRGATGMDGRAAAKTVRQYGRP